MLAVEAEFNGRVGEVERYFSFLRSFSEQQVLFENTSSFHVGTERDELFKTLKANGFLLMYNLMESTLKNCIEAIFDELKLRSVSFDRCRAEIRKIVLQNTKKHKVDKILENLTSISMDIASVTFRKDQLFSGNVDARLVRSLAAEYGFAEPSGRTDGLLTVKTNRNDLAHGLKSFAEVGRDFDLSRLDEILSQVVAFLRGLMTNVAAYIRARGYLVHTA